MRVDIHRYDPETQKKWVDTFEVSTEARSMTVMDILNAISANHDSSLAYYTHSVCNHGICARCAVLTNGRVRLACTDVVDESQPLTIGPVPNRTVVRDLVTKG